MRYQHIFFDLDHTLWDFDSNARECLKDIFDHYDLPGRAIESFDQFHSVYVRHNETLWSRFEKGYIGIEELKWRRMWRTLLDFKIADEKLSRDLSAFYMETLPTKNKVFEYTFEILDYLTKKGYNLHLLTNGFEKTQRGKLASSKLTSYFKEIITSEVSNSMKPKKEIFEFAMKQTGCCNRTSIMIGDNPAADIAGARNAGMDCIFVNHAGKNIQADSTFSIRHLRELESIL